MGLLGGGGGMGFEGGGGGSEEGEEISWHHFAIAAANGAWRETD